MITIFHEKRLNAILPEERQTIGIKRGDEVATTLTKSMKASAVLKSPGTGILEQPVLETIFYEKKRWVCYWKRDVILRRAKLIARMEVKVLGCFNRMACKGLPGLLPR